MPNLDSLLTDNFWLILVGGAAAVFWPQLSSLLGSLKLPLLTKTGDDPICQALLSMKQLQDLANETKDQTLHDQLQAIAPHVLAACWTKIQQQPQGPTK